MSERAPDGREFAELPSHLDENGVLTCPLCGCQDFDVYRVVKWDGGYKTRQRQCNHCGEIVETNEVPISRDELTRLLNRRY